jgi:hypothetical protein
MQTPQNRAQKSNFSWTLKLSRIYWNFRVVVYLEAHLKLTVKLKFSKIMTLWYSVVLLKTD